MSGSDSNMGQMGSMFGALGGGLGQLFGGYNNPADSAMPYFNQAANQLPGYFQPYMDAGKQALSPLESAYGNLLSNPGGVMNQIGQGYHQSPGYQFQMQQGMNASNNAAAAGGMAGTPMAQYNGSQFATGLANQDYYNYLSKALGMYGQGLQGEQGLANMGAGASMGLGEDLAGIYGAQGQLAYSGQQNQNQNSSGGIGSLISGAGGMASLAGLF